MTAADLVATHELVNGVRDRLVTLETLVALMTDVAENEYWMTDRVAKVCALRLATDGHFKEAKRDLDMVVAAVESAIKYEREDRAVASPRRRRWPARKAVAK